MKKPLLKRYLEEHFGGSRAFVQHVVCLAFYYLGMYRAGKSTELGRYSRVIFVCKGNICRSAYAEHKAHLMGLRAISAGIDTTPGRPAHTDAIRVAAARGVDLHTHKTKRLGDICVTKNDLLLAMEPSQIDFILQNYDIGPEQILLLGTLSTPTRPIIQDPILRSDAYFNRCYATIDSALDRMKRHMPIAFDTKSQQVLYAGHISR